MALPSVYQLSLFASEKRCPKCDEIKPRAAFYVRALSGDGLTARCKACLYTRVPPKPVYVSPTEKCCAQCGQVRSLEAFKRAKQTRDGHYSYCKTCDAARYAAYRRSHPDIVNARRRRYYYRHQEKEQAAARAYAAEHREERRAYNGQYHETHRAEERKWGREYRRAHPEKQVAWAQANKDRVLQLAAQSRNRNRERLRQREREYRAADPLYPLKNRWYSHKRRGLVRHAEGHYTPKDILALYEMQRALCAYCNGPLPTRYHIDHRIPLVRGGSHWPSNLALTCQHCNLTKMTKTDAEFMAHLHQ